MVAGGEHRVRAAALAFAGLLIAGLIAVPNVWRPVSATAAGDVCTPTGWMTVIPPERRISGEPTLAAPPKLAARPPRTEVVSVTVEVESP
jgi:hypothetical protein